MSNRAPIISVIIPVYRVSSLIERSLNSIINQTFRDFELVLVDDCGGDNSIEIAEELLAASWQRGIFKIEYNNSNLGVSASRQRGMEVASGDYIIHLDSDDYFEPNLLEMLYSSLIDTDSEIAVCGYWIEKKGFSERYYSSLSHITPFVIEGIEERSRYIGEILANKAPSALWNKLVKREVYERGEVSFLPHLRDDLSVSPLLVMTAKKVVVIPDALVHYVMFNAASVSYTIGHLKLVAAALNYLETRLSDEIKESCGREIFTYKVRIRRRLMLHRDMPVSSIDSVLNLFPEVNPELKAGNNPEKKRHFKLLARISAGGNTFLLRGMVRILKILPS
ncbi:MAG: glycosyltransferase family 2 protein [Bacteroidales bacterium]